MADINTRPFSKNYSGLVNQSVIGVVIAVLAITAQELMKRRRRSGKHFLEPGLGSKETWEFGYLYQGRSWAKHPSPPSPRGWPLSWVKQVVWFPEAEMNRLRGVDATMYIRFLRGCFYFALLHTCSTFLVLFPLHVELADHSVSPKSMTRASITSLVLADDGKSLLWVHICLLFWVTFTWIATLAWICNGTFSLRATQIQWKAERIASGEDTATDYRPHPHPQFGFTESPDITSYQSQPGLPLRTVMVSNVPPPLRSDKALQEYFEFYMSREIDKPAIGLPTATTQPGFLNRSFAFIFNRAKRLPAQIETAVIAGNKEPKPLSTEPSDAIPDNKPIIERVVIARKMTELADLLERREEVLRQLETAHLKLAQRTVLAVKSAMDRKGANKSLVSRSGTPAPKSRQTSDNPASNEGEEEEDPDCNMTEEERMEQLIQVIGPFVDEFDIRAMGTSARRQPMIHQRHRFRRVRTEGSEDEGPPVNGNNNPLVPKKGEYNTIWEALLAVPRSSLDPYQPLIRLSHLFTGKTVPSIDYYTRKLAVLNKSITENRAKAVSSYSPVSTAFVTFTDPHDALRACKYLAVHPDNPLACIVAMAPQYSDLDWTRVMKSSYNTEFLKDWVVNVGVWAFTLFWLFPVSFLVGLVSIQTLSIFIPSLGAYLEQHPWEQEVIQSFIPTLLVAVLALLIPMLLLLIAKKAHTITTLSALHDLIMTRYYKFLIVNVLVFFCVGTAALQSVLQSFSASASQLDVIQIVADSFPVAGPFYVGWLIFTSAMHGGFEIALFGLPLLLYPATSNQVTPRKRAVGIRPRTLNFYYWLPNHILVLHILVLFSVLNPFVLLFGTFYYFVQIGVIKNQLIHVYAKNYEGNGKTMLIRIVRYSLDGLVFAQAVFLAYMIVLGKNVNVGLAGFLIVMTVAVKLWLTRLCRAQFEKDDLTEAGVVLGDAPPEPSDEASVDENAPPDASQQERGLIAIAKTRPSLVGMPIPAWINFDSFKSKTIKRKRNPLRRNPIPFSHEIANTSQQLRESIHEEPATSDTHDKLRSRSPPTLNTSTQLTKDGPFVVPHPPPAIWDDQTNIDLPYDNPYYTRAICHHLWLPRNPFGVLDLDDTVSLKVSIAVEAHSQELGNFLGVPVSASPEIQASPGPAQLEKQETRRRPSMLELGPTHDEPVPIVDGTETIRSRRRLKRAELYGVERVPSPRRNTVIPRKTSSSSTFSIGSVGMHGVNTRHRSPSFGSHKSPGFRSFSASTMPDSFLERVSSGGTAAKSPRDQTALSLTDDPGLQPDIHAQGELIHNYTTSSHLSVASMAAPLNRSHNISTSDAITHEVMAEEIEHFTLRVEDEEAEARKAQNSRSWLTSWLYKR